MEAAEEAIYFEFLEEEEEEVIPQSSGHQLNNSVKIVTPSSGNSAESGGVVALPVSLPIGAASNVVKHDQLPHFKHMLYIDKSDYISSGTEMVSAHENAETIPNQQPRGENGDTGNISHDSVAASTECDESLAERVFPITCRYFCAELYSSKLGSGGRGRCVKYKENWYTPNEFEIMCGRQASKDWKRSIKSDGESLHTLIREGQLTPHASKCRCIICSNDPASKKPVQLFTPYKRRKCNETDNMESNPKRKRNKNTIVEQAASATVANENNQCPLEENITTEAEPLPIPNGSLDASTEVISEPLVNIYNQTFFVNINGANCTFVMATNGIPILNRM